MKKTLIVLFALLALPALAIAAGGGTPRPPALLSAPGGRGRRPCAGGRGADPLAAVPPAGPPGLHSFRQSAASEIIFAVEP